VAASAERDNSTHARPSKHLLPTANGFTYVWTIEGWFYATVVIDLFSRRVIGWSKSAAMTAQLVTDALVMAIWRRGKPANDVQRFRTIRQGWRLESG
jgi:transposase InsO family protein